MVDSSRVVRDSELFPCARHYNRCLVLVQPRKTGNGPSMIKTVDKVQKHDHKLNDVES